MKAMIFAAGLGTRLRPLTDDRPKALVTVGGRTLLEITLARLRTFGVREAIVNAHHFADQIVTYLAANGNFGMRIEVSREEDLLDTGGGMKKAAWFFLESGDEPFIVHNVDVLSSVDLAQMVEFHRQQSALATLAVQQRTTSRPLLFDGEGRLVRRGVAKDEPAPSQSSKELEWPGKKAAYEAKAAREDAQGLKPSSLRAADGPAEAVPLLQNRGSGPCRQHIGTLAFCGIHVISPRIFAKLDESGAFSIIDAYVRLASQGEKIFGFCTDGAYWRDLGRPEHLAEAERDLDNGKYPSN